MTVGEWALDVKTAPPPKKMLAPHESDASRFKPPPTLKLEANLRSKLHRAGIAERGNKTKRCRTSGGGDVRTQSAEVRVIEDIKHLASELNSHMFTKSKVLCGGEIDTRGWWAIDDTARRVTNCVGHPNC